MSNEKDCPFCGETIKKVAIKCKHCHSDLTVITNPISTTVSAEVEVELIKKVREETGVSLDDARQLVRNQFLDNANEKKEEIHIESNQYLKTNKILITKNPSLNDISSVIDSIGGGIITVSGIPKIYDGYNDEEKINCLHAKCRGGRYFLLHYSSSGKVRQSFSTPREISLAMYHYSHGSSDWDSGLVWSESVEDGSMYDMFAGFYNIVLKPSKLSFAGYAIVLILGYFVITNVFNFMDGVKSIVKKEILPSVKQKMLTNNNSLINQQANNTSRDEYIQNMVNEYKQNQARFHQKYRNTSIQGQGIIVDISADPLGTGLVFYVAINVNGSIVYCDTENLDVAASLSKRQKVKFSGVVDDVMLNVLQVTDCEFSSVR